MGLDFSGWFVTANDIRKWTETNKRQSEEILPLLVQKLILASCKPREISFPSGDMIGVGGWDGILEVDEGNGFIPNGKSGWEFGTESVVNQKADRDYAKRTNKPAPFNSKETTFVFVTSRLWTKKHSWVADKKKKKKWRDIRGINAEDLAVWLERCPAVHRWFARIVGKRTEHIWDLDQAWEALSYSTSLHLNRNLFINSRDNEKGEMLNQLSQAPSLIKVQSQSEKEAYGFILSCLKTEILFSSKALVIKDQGSWDWLIDFDQSLVLIPDGFRPSAIGRAVTKGHHVLLPLSVHHAGSTNDGIHINQMPRQDRILALQEIGLSETQAEQVYSATKGYLEPILRHSLLRALDIQAFEVRWKDKVDSAILFAALLATEWDESNQNDREMLSTLSGIEYLSFEKTINELSREPDPPIRLLGNIWQVISKTDMWHLVGSRLSKLHLSRLEGVAKQTMADLDPSYDIKAEERFMASVMGAIPIYSSHLKSGIADSLALLATYGNDYARDSNIGVPNHIRAWVKQIFDAAKDSKAWFSFGNRLPLLAEAAPEEFLEAVNKMIRGKTPLIIGLFEAEGNGVFGGCPHADLLWALERISWNKSYLSSVSNVLARLSEIDPGGTYSNRPFRSLVDLFLGWVNNTQATYDERLQIIQDVLLSRFPKIAWKLLIALLPQNTRFTSGINKPTYQEWARETKRSVSRNEFSMYISAIVKLLFREVEKDIDERLPDLLENISKFDNQHQTEFVIYLKNINIDKLNPSTRQKAANKLRKHISHYREFTNKEQLSGEGLIFQLEEIYNKFALDDVVKKNLYLFDGYLPELIHPVVIKDSDYKHKEELLTKTRVAAIEEIFELKGIEGIEELTRESNYPTLIGYVLPRSKYPRDFEIKLEDWIERNDAKLLEVVRMYIASKQGNMWAYMEELLAHNSNWSTKIKVNLLLSLPAEKRTFVIVDKQNDEIQNDYWNGLYSYSFFFKESAEAQYVATKFVEHNKPLAALGAISQYLERGGSDEIDINLVATILKRIINDPSDIDSHHKLDFHHYLSNAIRFIEDSQELSENETAQIEWAILPVFRYDEFIPNRLSKIVAKDASFFAQLVIWVFRSEQEKLGDQPLDDSVKSRAEAAHDIIEKISIIPGDSGGVINADFLNQWVDDARKILHEADRIAIGDDRIGNYLSHSPVGSDGVWPHEAVRSVIERVKSTELDLAIRIGKENARGMTSRLPYEGGKQEHVLAAQYSDDAKKIELSYPRTAELLRNIGRDYATEARRHDWRSELRD
jgi:hypothetical protein